MKTIRAQVLLTPQLHKRAKHIGVEIGQSLSSLVRQALENYLDDIEKAIKRRSVIDNTVGTIKLNDSGWKNANIQKYIRNLRKDRQR